MNFYEVFLILENSLKFANFFCWGNEFSIYDLFNITIPLKCMTSLSCNFMSCIFSAPVKTRFTIVQVQKKNWLYWYVWPFGQWVGTVQRDWLKRNRIYNLNITAVDHQFERRCLHKSQEVSSRRPICHSLRD